jgi:hypothetical protein
MPKTKEPVDPAVDIDLEEPKAPTPERATVPTRGRRYRLFDKGDVLILSIVGENHPQFPPGTLLPIEGVPQFNTKAEANSWIGNSGDLLSGLSVMVVKAMDRHTIEVINTPTVRIHSAPKKAIDE